LAGLSKYQVIGGWGPGVTETTPSQVVLLFAKPCRMTGVYDTGVYGVFRTECLVWLPRRGASVAEWHICLWSVGTTIVVCAVPIITLIGPGEHFVSKKLTGDSAFEIV